MEAVVRIIQVGNAMSYDRLVVPLQHLPLFATLKPEQLEEIAQRAEKLRFKAGDVITHAGAQADGAYLIVSGQADRIDAGAGDREQIVPGSMIGEMAMLIEQTHRATVVARDRVLCLKIHRAALTQQMLEDPSLADGLHAQMTQRLLKTAEQLRRIDSLIAGSLTPDRVGMSSHASSAPQRPQHAQGARF